MIDHEALKEISGGEEEFIREILELFLTTYKEPFDAIRDAVQNNDVHLVETTSHTFKGMVGNITTGEPFILAQELVTMAREDTLEKAADTFASLEKNVEQLVEEIKLWLTDNPSP
ncbi:MAG: Hpt domain-containing protein [Waddliaceae bacterium]|jgi:HPt (histidine-containing phosphotransfer) domain-containing protein|nr:Hpt domain-containing protein [Waddliaceae bacterium]MBT3578933.1 Hpt domain-containing protein [Waddliaceae bacterium]MBT4445508.1 Hpt domain-containing protein [Waddliaceae bacterium]MBT6928999.1 Hpt domain-containing protein [Waddliaceae bacterium]MBT7461718.1 Hpt domain-containing protein [Waddliaceae bacterium]